MCNVYVICNVNWVTIWNTITIWKMINYIYVLICTWSQLPLIFSDKYNSCDESMLVMSLGLNLRSTQSYIIIHNVPILILMCHIMGTYANDLILTTLLCISCTLLIHRMLFYFIFQVLYYCIMLQIKGLNALNFIYSHN